MAKNGKDEGARASSVIAMSISEVRAQPSLTRNLEHNNTPDFRDLGADL